MEGILIESYERLLGLGSGYSSLKLYKGNMMGLDFQMPIFQLCKFELMELEGLWLQHSEQAFKVAVGLRAGVFMVGLYP